MLRTLAAAAGGFVFVCTLMYLWGWIFRPDLPDAPRAYEEAELAALEELRDTTLDTTDPPVVWQDVDYSEGEAAAWWPRGEPPVLAPLVAEGTLPPVAARVGSEPLVLTGVDGIGQYGGAWLRIANSEFESQNMSIIIGQDSLVRYSPHGEPIVPNVAKGWEVSDDHQTWTFFLRKGMRWSDGHPFTTADVKYWWDWEETYTFPDRWPDWLLAGGKPAELEIIDETTFRLHYPRPKPNLLKQIANQRNWKQPAHYLRQFHEEIGNPELIAELQETFALPRPESVYGRMKQHTNPELPHLFPWIYRIHKTNPPQIWVRNPYFWAVDSAGNQLPYLDRVVVDVTAANLIPVRASQGGVTMQTRHIQYRDYTLYMSQRESGGYEVYHWYNAKRTIWTLWPNLNRHVDPDEPMTAVKAKLLADVRFRQALSLAINREAIIEAEYNNVGEPAQAAPGRESRYHHEELLKSFTDHDPARANALLDAIGLTSRDSEGYRLGPDGNRLTFYIDFTVYTGAGPIQFIVDDWAAVGVRAIPRERARSLFYVEKRSRRHDFSVWTGEGEFDPIMQPRSFVPVNTESHYAQAYAVWFQEGGLYGKEEAWERGWEPEPGSPIRTAMELLDEASVTADPQRQQELIRQILDIAAEQVFSISIATSPPQLVLVDDRMRNVPRTAVFAWDYATPSNAGHETFYLTENNDTPGAIAQLQNAIRNPELPPRLAAESGSAVVKALIRWLFVGIIVALLVMLSLRHPFVGRRLVILVPTLFIMSVVIFAIIQAPPGSYLESRLLEAEITGDPGLLEQVDDLKLLFNFDAPVWLQYLEWSGLKWFVTFAEADRGLLQGNLGRSMETSRLVNDVVGDRILLTFLISLGTIIFTWAMAIPIGIYSAVRQYSLGDYIFTFIGFLGMCIPNFLLALVLIYWAREFLGLNISGLFSPEYAVQPEWTWGKFKDLLAHIWVPIVVLGTGGTAGMIRVMRGNLLDELRKPYVTTARAKGVRPLKLILKYPVRLALNPFISGIGHIFPLLVSGGAIVAIVLSLPTVGPLMLSALMTEDLYLAGSMLMVLSLLGVFGTLVSDLLLLWLDPRIRMEGRTSR